MVWAHFNVLEDTPHLAKCALCSTKIARGKIDDPKKSYSVKGLWDHLNAKHKEAYKSAKANQEEFASKKKQNPTLARVYLSVLAGSAASERLFSTGKNVL